MPKKSSSAWCDREIAQEEQKDRKRIVSKWVKCAICDRTRLPGKYYRQNGVCKSCEELYKNATPGKGLDINRIVGRREDKNAKPQ